MKNKILILLASIALTGCFNQSREGCPADMFLTFGIDDPHEPTMTYDVRVGGDLTLYLFKDKRVVSAKLIPYAEISNGKEYVIRKSEETSGDIDLLAFAVTDGGDASLIPRLTVGQHIDDIDISLPERTRAEVDSHPTDTHLHMARITNPSEALDRETWHEMGLNHTECRMEVHITDKHGALQAGSDPRVCVYGTMTHMDMDKKGHGQEAVVYKPLTRPTNNDAIYTTGRFGVMPSAGEQTVNVVVSDGANELAYLNVPRSALPQGAVSGGLIVFEYTLNAPDFTIVTDGFRQNIVIADM